MGCSEAEKTRTALLLKGICPPLNNLTETGIYFILAYLKIVILYTSVLYLESVPAHPTQSAWPSDEQVRLLSSSEGEREGGTQTRWPPSK